jgi:alginate O-acetyltransferase complex protein AlgI
MGGNRVSRVRWIFNIFTVWMLTGLWHGAAWNFVLWGLLFALLLAAEKFLAQPIQKLGGLYRIVTLLVLTVSFVLFDSATLAEAAHSIGGLFGFGDYALVTTESVYFLRSYAVVFLIAIVGATPLPKRIVSRIGESEGGERLLNSLEPLVLFLLLAVCTAFLVDGSFNPFLYFRF